MTPLLTIAWRVRQVPLAPCAVLALGDVATALAHRLLARPAGSLRGLHSAGLLCVLGAEDDLPWVDGVEYLGRDPRAPALRLPTSIEPDVDPQLLERALVARANSLGCGGPLAVTHRRPRLFSLANAKLVTPEGLRLFVEET